MLVYTHIIHINPLMYLNILGGTLHELPEAIGVCFCVLSFVSHTVCIADFTNVIQSSSVTQMMCSAENR